jgi:transposase
MAKSLSVDLRKRVIVAIEAGASCRQAATRFGVSASSAIRWHRLSKGKGDVTPQLQGDDRRSKRIEGYADAIMAELAKAPDITLADLRGTLAGQGVAVSIAGLWRFFGRRRITLKKRPGMRPNRIVPTS